MLCSAAALIEGNHDMENIIKSYAREEGHYSVQIGRSKWRRAPKTQSNTAKKEQITTIKTITRKPGEYPQSFALFVSASEQKNKIESLVKASRFCSCLFSVIQNSRMNKRQMQILKRESKMRKDELPLIHWHWQTEQKERLIDWHLVALFIKSAETTAASFN